MPAFCEKVVDEAESTFYREMAGLARGFIRSEDEEIRRRLGNGRDSA